MANHPGKAPRAPMIGAKADLKPLGRVIGLLFRDYPAMLIITMLCIIISAVVGILPAIYIETVTSYIEDGLTLGWGGVQGKILHALATMVGIYLAGLACTAVYTQLMAHVTQGFLHKLRTRMFAGMQKLPIRYFDQNSRGDIMSYYTNDIDTLRQLVSQSLPQLFASGLTVLGLLLFMLYFSIPLMLIVFLGIFFMTQATKNIGGKSAKYFLNQQRSLGKVEGYIEEMMNGQKVVKVFCHEEAAERDFDAINDQLFDDANHAQRYANIFMPIMGNIGNILYVLTAFLGGLLICSGGSVPNLSFQNLFETGSMIAPLKIAVVASFLGMTKQFTGNVSQVSQQINAIVMALAGAALLASGVAAGNTARYAILYPEVLSGSCPVWAAWADLLLPIFAGAWLLNYAVRAFSGFGLQRQRLGSSLLAGAVPLVFLWRLIWRFQFAPASLCRMPCTLRVLSAAAALLLAVVLIKIFLVPGLPCGHTLYAAGTGAFLLCTGLELPQTLFEAARGMLTLPDLLTGIGIGLFGLCGLVCAWEACGKETE